MLHRFSKPVNADKLLFLRMRCVRLCEVFAGMLGTLVMELKPRFKCETVCSVVESAVVMQLKLRLSISKDGTSRRDSDSNVSMVL